MDPNPTPMEKKICPAASTHTYNISNHTSGGSRISPGGNHLCREAPTPEAAMFCKICMSKRKNQDPWGDGAPRAPPLDPPIQITVQLKWILLFIRLSGTFIAFYG